MRRGLAFALVLVCAVAATAGWTASSAEGPATVYAAASLTDVFPKLSPSSRFQFASSNQLALQITRGAPADVFASASPIYTQDLYRAGLVEKPRAFATNSLVLAVPRSNPARIRTVQDLAKRPKLKLVVAGAKVPIGLYTREVLKRLGLLRVLRKAVSQEPDVKGIVGKLALGEADAGFVYATDVRAASSRLIAIQLPKRSQPTVLLRGRGREGLEQPRGCARVRSRPAQHRWQARAPEARGSGFREKPVRGRARARDRTRSLVPHPSDRRDLPRHPAGALARRDERPGRHRRAARDLEDDADRERVHPADRDAGRILHRDAHLSGQAVARDRRRAPARAATRCRRDRVARGLRPLRAPRGSAQLLRASRSPSPRSPSSSP